MKRVLVTGANGFVGRHCLQPLIARGYEVHALTRTLSHPAADLTWHRGDLLTPNGVGDLLQLLRPDHLLHLAWVTSPGQYWHSPDNLLWVEASLTLLRQFADCGGKRVVVAGTCAEYDWRYGLCREEVTPLAPTTCYGGCKHALAQLLRAWSSVRKISSAWGRLFHLHGPHEDTRRLVPSVVCSLLRGEPAMCSHGKQIRDFLHVADAAEGLVVLLDSEFEGVMNIASGEPVRIEQVTKRIGALVGRPDLIRMGSISAPVDDPPLLVADVTRLRTVLNWRPMRDLDTGLTATVHWWQSSQNGEAA